LKVCKLPAKFHGIFHPISEWEDQSIMPRHNCVRRLWASKCFFRECVAAAATAGFFAQKRSANVASAARCWSLSHCHRKWRS